MSAPGASEGARPPRGDVAHLRRLDARGDVLVPGRPGEPVAVLRGGELVGRDAVLLRATVAVGVVEPEPVGERGVPDLEGVADLDGGHHAGALGGDARAA